jgi:butyrate kinase
MERKKKILIINPGSTSTKIALYESDKLMINESVGHSADELKQFKNIWEQYEFRKRLFWASSKNMVSPWPILMPLPAAEETANRFRGAFTRSATE